MKKNKTTPNDIKALENRYKFNVPKELYTVIKLDGINFKKTTAELKKPYDERLGAALSVAMQDVAKDLNGCFYAYNYSDKVVFFIGTEAKQIPAFNNEIQAVASVVASKFTLAFQRALTEYIAGVLTKAAEVEKEPAMEDLKGLVKVQKSAIFKATVFSTGNEDLYDVVEVYQNQCVEKSILGYAASCGIDVKGKTLDSIRGELFDNGTPWESSDVPPSYKYGLGYQRLEDENGKMLWKSSVFLGKVANKLHNKEVKYEKRKANE